MKKVIIIIVLIATIAIVSKMDRTSTVLENCFRYSGNLIARTAYHQSILLDSNEVLITGGLTLNNAYDDRYGSKTAQIYSLKEKKSYRINDMNINHLFHKMFKMKDGNVVVADTNGIEIFDIKTKKFKLLKTKPKERYQEFYNYKYLLLSNDLLLIIGGRRERSKEKNGANSVDLNIGEIIDLKNDKLIKEFKIKGNGFGLINLKDGNTLIIGGKEKTLKEEKLSDAIYLLESNTLTLRQWGKLPIPIANPFVFLTSDSKAVILGGEVFKKNEKWKEFNYIHTKGSNNIYIIDILTKKITQKSLKEFFESKEFKNDCVRNNFIVDVIQYDDKIYLLDLGKSQNSFIFLNIEDLTTEKIFKSFNTQNTLFRYSTVKHNNNIYLFGGKLTYMEGAAEYDLREQHPSSIDELLPSVDGFIVDTVQVVSYKNKGK